MKNVSIMDYSDEHDLFVSVSGDGNMEAADRVLEELDKCPIDSYSVRVNTAIRPDGTKNVTFFLNMTFKKSSEAFEAYKEAGGE